MKNRKNHSERVERRDFLKIMSLTGVGGLFASKDSLIKAFSPAAKSKVVVVTDTNATDKVSKTVNTDVVREMVDSGLKTYTGISDVGSAWKSIFPGISAGSVIGLKVNTLFETRNTGTHPQIAYAVADGLVQMDFDGTKFPANNIIIFDFHVNYLPQQGYTINKTTTGVRCFPSTLYSTEQYDIEGVKVRLSRIITESVDYIVNIAYLKQHFLSGVSLCMKNNYGSIHNPEISPLLHDPGRCGSPYIAAINALEPLKSKQKFFIIDALYGVIVNGPQGTPNVNPDKILMGQDIVAMDTTGRELLKSLGLATAQVNKTGHIDVAASTYSLGTNNLSEIEVVNTGSTAMGLDDYKSGERTGNLLRNTPNPFNTLTEISFSISMAQNVQLNIYSYAGKLIHTLINRKLKEGLHNIYWDGHDSGGLNLPDGVYLCELKTTQNSQSIIIQKFK